MDVHYNAFISYRHHPDDMRVAAEVHRSLERFRVPGAIKKRSGVISRIFRDKEELPITSKLSDDISGALRNSDFLIVICSEHTKESIWVQREIETFLKTHTRDEVLTVLAGGDPYEVMPEILLYEDVTDPVTGETHREERELLSCDWRMGLRKAKREELPRLAAPLLKCSYDELRQRQRQYRMRRMIAWFSAAMAASLCLAAYFLHTSITIQRANVQIQANLDQAMRNQSEYLAAESLSSLDSGDRLSALALALEALPGEGNERPYVPAAERALCTAMGMYDSASWLTAVGAITPDNRATVEEILLSEDYNTLYVLDSRNVITLWDAHTMEKTGSVDLGDVSWPELRVLPGGGLLVFEAQSNSLRCYDEEGTLRWETTDCEDVACTENGDSVLQLREETEGYRLLFIDPATGEEQREAVFLPPMENSGILDFCQERYSGAFPMALAYDDFTVTQVLTIDPDTGETMILFETENYVRHVAQTDDGKLLLMVPDGSGEMNGTFFGMRITSPARSDIYCLDSVTGEFLWQSEITTYSYSAESTLERIPGTDRILCHTGNTLQQIDGSTGEILAACETAGAILMVLPEENQARIIQEDGYTGTYSYADNDCAVLKTLEEGLLDAEFGWYNDMAWYYGCWAEEGQVTIYSPWVDKPDWSVEGNAYKFAAQGDRFAWYESGDSQVVMLDLQTQEVLWTSGKESLSEMLGFSRDGKTLWTASYGQVTAFDGETGEYSVYELPEEVDGERLFYTSDPLLCEDAVCFTGMAADVWYLVIWEPLMDSVRYIPLWPEEEDPVEDIFAMDIQSGEIHFAWESYLWLWASDGRIWEVNTESETLRPLPEQAEKLPSFAIREEDGVLALAVGTEIVLRVPGGDELMAISLENDMAGSLAFHDGRLYALCDNGFILVFDGDGKQIARVEADLDTGFSESLFSPYREPMDILWWFTEDGNLILKAFYVTNIIDCEAWGCRGYALYCEWYHEASDVFVTSNDGTVCGYRRRSLEENIAAAWEQLGSYRLTQEQRASYGID